MRTTWHGGVYALMSEGRRLVVVRKRRGPYTGLLDLPGGTPEPGETPWETLRRELAEECGARLIAASDWRTFALRVRRSSSGEPIDFRHAGRIARARTTPVRSGPPAEDVSAVELRMPSCLRPGECSAPLAWALGRLPR